MGPMRQPEGAEHPANDELSREHWIVPAHGLSCTDPDGLGLRIRRIRIARDKSLRVVSGLAGMSRSTLHRVEHGQREPTLSEIVALAGALQIDPAKLIELTILAPVHS